MPGYIYASPESSLGLIRLREGITQRAGLELRRIEDDLRAWMRKLLDVVALHVLVLDGEHARPRPFAVGAELDLADDGLEGAVVDDVGDFRLVERSRLGDRLGQDVGRGIGEGRDVIAERIGAGVLGARLVLGEEGVDAREIHRPFVNEELVTDDAVERL